MAGRRSDTRVRIQRVALELFAEQGYEKTTLREVADRLRITRPALYYHYKAKEDILAGVMADLADSVDELNDWARAQPATEEARREVLRRIFELLDGQWRPLLRFIQVNQAVMRKIPAGQRMRDSFLAMLAILATPEMDPAQRFQVMLAVVAILLGSVPIIDMGLTDDERAGVALQAAFKLIGGLPGDDGDDVTAGPDGGKGPVAR
ncbi:TetR/AcrR family transcriptional regulator [Spongiactinospora rosea]|uniref:TetR/AcrR family transcriptional regulator n=1 Tax=Spongiactinospora rosea TaxID=2248750 RepID=A0A366M6H0_9ACTN|nr:TetR/AcrR family transcriptional regulator [Spongiactinospora rosea]RBQ21320.1 TetR/AcrR family transcriptional regulator [Spongiactinospora rosea]